MASYKKRYESNNATYSENPSDNLSNYYGDIIKGRESYRLDGISPDKFIYATSRANKGKIVSFNRCSEGMNSDDKKPEIYSRSKYLPQYTYLYWDEPTDEIPVDSFDELDPDLTYFDGNTH